MNIKLVVILFTINLSMSFAQEIIKLPYKESLKESFPVNSYYSPTSEVDLIDNISEPELEVFLAEKPNGKAIII